jgi:hypothetical protein
MTTLIQTIEADAKAAEGTISRLTRVVDGVEKPLFAAAKVDIRNELPALLGKMGINTADEKTVIHSVLTLLVDALIQYGPEEIRALLTVAA